MTTKKFGPQGTRVAAFLEHVEALLRPFAKAGYGSASAVFASVTTPD